MSRKKAIMSWSSGKDSAMALHVALRDPEFDIVALASNFSAGDSRVQTHKAQREIVRAQADALNLPLIEIDLPVDTSNDAYRQIVGAVATSYREKGVHDWIFGDLFLQDIRDWRVAHLEPLGITSHFPIWGTDTATLAQDMLAAGLETYVVALDHERAPAEFCGARFDQAFLDALPATVDPCGENGEFHTLVANAPGFAHPLTLQRGETTQQGRFTYTDFALA